MRDTFGKKFDLLTNIAIIVVALIAGATLIKNQWTGKQSQLKVPMRTASPTPYQGTHISLREMDWSAKDKTMVFVLSTKCHFCSESVPFYQSVLRKTSALPHLAAVAVFPQDELEAKSYADKSGLPFDRIVHSDLKSIAIRGTPTLLLVDSKGIVQRSWAGQLSKKQESDVMDSLGDPLNRL